MTRDPSPTGLGPNRPRATRAEAIAQGQGVDFETPTELHVADWTGGVTVWHRTVDVKDGKALYEVRVAHG